MKALPSLVAAVRDSGCKVIWTCDPMHGNTFKANGYKTRDFNHVVTEIANTIQIHKKAGTRFNGLHLEMTGEDVTECVGGPQKLTPEDLPRCFASTCDPRLNFQQAIGVAFAVGKLLQTKPLTQKKNTNDSQLTRLPAHPSVTYGVVKGMEKPVSRLIFGTLGLHKTKEPMKLLDDIWAAGCNAFDTAAIYGEPEGKCEAILGQWIKSRNIDTSQLVIITKGGCSGADSKWTPRIDRHQIVSDLAGSLDRLGVPSIDLYLLHRDDPSIAVSDIVDTMTELVNQKKIEAWGVSNWALDRLQSAISYAAKNGKSAPVVDSTQASLAKPRGAVWPGTTYMTPARSEFYAKNKASLGVFAWEALAKGFMCGKWTEQDVNSVSTKDYREKTLINAYCTGSNFKRRHRAELLSKSKGVPMHQIALSYLLNLDCNMFVLVGTTKSANFASNVGMFDVQLSDNEVAWLNEGGNLHSA